MIKVSMQLQVRDTASGELVPRTYSYINKDFIGLLAIPFSDAPPSPEDTGIPGAMLPPNYNTFWDWVDSVSRGLASLSQGNYTDSIINATWSTVEEEAS